LRRFIEGKALAEGVVAPTTDSPPVNPVAEFVIHARDKYGNTGYGGGDTWKVLVTRPDGIRYGTANSGRASDVTPATSSTLILNPGSTCRMASYDAASASHGSKCY